MNTIRISRTCAFYASYALQASDGHCKPIQAHYYKLRVTLLGTPKAAGPAGHGGLCMHFDDLKRFIEAFVVKPWEGALLLHQDAPAGLIESWKKIDKKLVLLPYQPTCENLLLDIRTTLLEHLPPGAILHSLRLSETDATYMEWNSADNTYLGYADEENEPEVNHALIMDSLSKANTSHW
ncbi:6-carboxytetrahydropterin synthase QueD [Cesiribacter andamanensis]|uniref:6-carboxy-5,6,7,8-tetrahydropterin synthase n=1 Tax=Cesiribacter andamanensis AMV16 TaxID=1279009 RepID=M7N854_9BACT|nr:6-carboxytetrahydropterin synthase QueD [Cesiribacter andamanensis]EMR03391.1 queuosine biosynthesis protein QueD [Cesiribacter andamanensis AMV16]